MTGDWLWGCACLASSHCVYLPCTLVVVMETWGSKGIPQPLPWGHLGTFLGACQQPSHHRTWPLQGRPGDPSLDHRWNVRCVSGASAWHPGRSMHCQVMPGGRASTALSWDVTDKHLPSFSLSRSQPTCAEGVAFKKENPKAFKSPRSSGMMALGAGIGTGGHSLAWASRTT